jgi:TPR repeat protein
MEIKLTLEEQKLMTRYKNKYCPPEFKKIISGKFNSYFCLALALLLSSDTNLKYPGRNRYQRALELLNYIYQECNDRELKMLAAGSLYGIYDGQYRRHDGEAIVAPDKKKSIEYLEVAAESKSSGFLYNLALEYEQGTVVAKNVIRAFELYEEAIKSARGEGEAVKGGHNMSAYNLAVMYLRNDDVPNIRALSQDERIQQGHHYLLMAAKSNNNAQFILGNHYLYREKILGIEKLTPNQSYRLAIGYLKTAAKQNHLPAAALLSKLNHEVKKPTITHLKRYSWNGDNFSSCAEQTDIPLTAIHDRYNESIHKYRFVFFKNALNNLGGCLTKLQEMYHCVEPDNPGDATVRPQNH